MALFKPFRGTRASLDAVEKHDGYAYFCTDDGSFHIDYVDADGNLQRKQVNEDYIKQIEDLAEKINSGTGGGTSIQPDWEQNDTTQPDYIKNKPFERLATGGDTLSWDGNIEGRESLYDILFKVSDVVPTIDDFANGYSIVVDGERVELTSNFIVDEGGDFMVVGDPTNPEDSFPFVCVVYDETKAVELGVSCGIYLLYLDWTELGVPLICVSELTINNYTGFPYVKKLNPDYLPEHQHKWEDIEDRTHWTEEPVTTIETILEEATLDGFADGMLDIEQFVNLKDGVEYTVTWDGCEYTCVAKTVTAGVEAIILGNPLYIGMDEDNGRPFCIGYIPSMVMASIITENVEETQHTVGITKVTTTQTVHKLDDKYINADWLPQSVTTPITIFAETTATVTPDGTFEPSWSYDIKAFDSAEYVDVLWNGDTYRCPRQEAVGISFFGNAKVGQLPNAIDTGEPFIFISQPGALVVMTKEETEATFSITGYNTALASTMPTQYLPEALQFGYDYEAEVSKDVITWDGDITGRAVFDDDYYHVSTAVPTVEDLSNGGTIEGAEFTVSDVLTLDNGMGFAIMGMIYIFTSAAVGLLGIPAGIYFLKFGDVEGQYVSSFTINNCTFTETVIKPKPIDLKYLPEDIGGGSGLPEVTTDDNGAFLRVIDGAWAITKLPNAEEGEF